MSKKPKEKKQLPFQNIWLTDPQFKFWIKKVDIHTAGCTWCKIEFSLCTRSTSAFLRHMDSARHKKHKKEKQQIQSFFKHAPTDVATATNAIAATTTTSTSAAIDTYVPTATIALAVFAAPTATSSTTGAAKIFSDEQRINAEIIWTSFCT